MKKVNLSISLKPLFFVILAMLVNTMVWSQENSGDDKKENNTTTTTTTTEKTDISISSDDATTGEWYTSPWVWVVGAAIFILLLVALLSNRGRDTVSTSDRVTVKKTVERDTGTDV